jgi:hypothetical protein
VASKKDNGKTSIVMFLAVTKVEISDDKSFAFEPVM